MLRKQTPLLLRAVARVRCLWPTGVAVNRRSKAGREATNRRPRKTSKPERGRAPKSQARIKSTPAIEETQLARLTHELTDERRQRTAISEVLHLLSGSHGDLSCLFDTILTNATNLCQANFGTLCLYEGDAFRVVHSTMRHLPTPNFADASRWSERVRCCVWLRLSDCST